VLNTRQCEELLVEYPTLYKHVDGVCLMVLREAQIVEIPAGTVVFHEASPCKNFMWLLEGRVRVFRNSEEGREVTVYRVSPGELCLLSLNSLLNDGGYPASATSETDTKGLMITAEQFHHLMDHSRGFRNYVLQALVERLTDVISLASDVTFRRLDLRLACLLGQQFERSGGSPLKITHADLACELGTTREVISRILKEFERQQCISLNRGMIQLVSQDGLEWFARKDRKAG
jgi:CRP/FNR family transcriptional regulator, anaerobic regulatory protein